MKRLLFLGLILFGVPAWAANVTGQLNYRKPNLEFVTVTTVTVGNNTGTAHQTKIIFPDGNVRSVTEAAADGEKNFRHFDITQVATFTACVNGSATAGLQEHTGLLRSLGGEAANTWYSLYAVKSQCAGGTNAFTTVGTTWAPTQSYFTQLNSTFGVNGWTYLGTIRNGANITGNTLDILSFVQMGNITLFDNTAQDSGALTAGVYLSSAALTISTWTYSAGFTGTAVPPQFSHGTFEFIVGATAVTATATDANANEQWVRWLANATNTTNFNSLRPLSGGAAITTSAAAQSEIFLYGFFDKAIGFVTTP